MNKICNSCKLEKDIDQFNWKNKEKGIRQGYCRECKKSHQRKYYNRSKDAYLETIMRTRKLRRDEALEKAKKYLQTHPCVDCGNADIRVLHFDHVRSEKFRGVCEMIQHGFSWEKIEGEIAKCDIRCSNCHMIKTWPDRWNNMALSSSG